MLHHHLYTDTFPAINTSTYISYNTPGSLSLHLLFTLLALLTNRLTLTGRLRDPALRIHPSKALHLLGKTRVAALRPRGSLLIQHLTLELAVEGVDELLPAVAGLAGVEVLEDPLALLLDVGGDDVAEADVRVAADLLHGALVQRGDGDLVAPVEWRRVGEDARARVRVREADQEFVLLVEGRAVGEQLEAAGDELRAVVLLAMGKVDVRLMELTTPAQ